METTCYTGVIAQMLSHSFKRRFVFYELSPRGMGYGFVSNDRDVAISCKSRHIFRLFCHVTKLSQKHVAYTVWQICFYLFAEVVLFFARWAKCYQSGAEVRLSLPHQRNVAT